MKNDSRSCFDSASTLFTLTLCLTRLEMLTAQQTAASTPCQFCKTGEITTPEKPVSIPGYEFIDSCGTIDSLLPSILVEGAPECDLVQSVSSLCGCPKPQNSCSFCPDGSSVGYPDLPVTWLSEEFGGFAPSCEMVEAYAASLSETDETCQALQLLSSFCGCPPLPNHCKFCAGEPLKEEFYDVQLPFLRSETFGTANIGFTPTCEALYATQYQLENQVGSGSLCFDSNFAVTHCGCNDGNLFYHGTAEPTKHAVLVWLPRSVGILSLCASILVLSDILRDPKKRKDSIYHQLVGTAAVFDMITSIVWIVGPAAINPFDEAIGYDYGFYGAAGNDTTCQVQAYFFQLGLTSVFLNVSLTAYFMLAVVFGYREQRLRRKKLWLFGAPLVLGFALSFAVIPFSGHSFTHCQFNSTISLVLVFCGLLPILGSSFSILLMLLIIYCSVRRQARRQRRWGFKETRTSTETLSRGSQQSSLEQRCRQQKHMEPTAKQRKAARKSKLERLVFRQCLAYAAAFGITWPFLAVALVKGQDFDLPYGFWVAVTATAALQGFNNAVCYFRIMRNPRDLFRCTGFRKSLSSCCQRVAHNGGRIVSRFSLDMLYRSSADPASLEDMSSVSPSKSQPDDDLQHLDPAVELANLSDNEEDAIFITTANDSREAMSNEKVIAECGLESVCISDQDVAFDCSCSGNQRSLADGSQRFIRSPIDDLDELD